MFCLQAFLNYVITCPGKVLVIYTSDHYSLFRHNLWAPIFTTLESIKFLVLDSHFAFPHRLPYAPNYIGTDVFTFGLSKGTQHSEEYLTICFKGIDAFLFEDNCDAQL